MKMLFIIWNIFSAPSSAAAATQPEPYASTDRSKGFSNLCQLFAWLVRNSPHHIVIGFRKIVHFTTYVATGSKFLEKFCYSSLPKFIHKAFP